MHPDQDSKQTIGAQTLRRGLSVLRLLTQIGPRGLRMLEITRRLDLNKATVIRLTRTLVDEGFVLHDKLSGRYRLGPGAFAAGLAAESSYELQRLAAPTLRDLVAESGDVALFTVLHGYETICLSAHEGDYPIKNYVMKAGDRSPLGVGAGATALLAALSDEEVDDVLLRNAELRAKQYPRCTDAAIRKLIQETREHGYCINPGLVLEDSWAIGVAVYDADGPPVASISIAAFKSRMGYPRCVTLGNRLMQASRALTDMQTTARSDERDVLDSDSHGGGAFPPFGA